jgi:hypothetical protein
MCRCLLPIRFIQIEVEFPGPITHPRLRSKCLFANLSPPAKQAPWATPVLEPGFQGPACSLAAGTMPFPNAHTPSKPPNRGSAPRVGLGRYPSMLAFPVRQAVDLRPAVPVDPSTTAFASPFRPPPSVHYSHPPSQTWLLFVLFSTTEGYFDRANSQSCRREGGSQSRQRSLRNQVTTGHHSFSLATRLAGDHVVKSWGWRLWRHAVGPGLALGTGSVSFHAGLPKEGNKVRLSLLPAHGGHITTR